MGALVIFLNAFNSRSLIGQRGKYFSEMQKTAQSLSRRSTKINEGTEKKPRKLEDIFCHARRRDGRIDAVYWPQPRP